MGRRGGGRRREEEGGGGRRREERREEEGGGRGDKAWGWRNRDREMYTCACVFCVRVQGYVHVDV